MWVHLENDLQDLNEQRKTGPETRQEVQLTADDTGFTSDRRRDERTSRGTLFKNQTLKKSQDLKQSEFFSQIKRRF